MLRVAGDDGAAAGVDAGHVARGDQGGAGLRPPLSRRPVRVRDAPRTAEVQVESPHRQGRKPAVGRTRDGRQVPPAAAARDPLQRDQDALQERHARGEWSWLGCCVEML